MKTKLPLFIQGRKHILVDIAVRRILGPRAWKDTFLFIQEKNFIHVNIVRKSLPINISWLDTCVFIQGRNPYVCEHCGGKFNQSSGLTRHKCTHPKDRRKTKGLYVWILWEDITWFVWLEETQNVDTQERNHIPVKFAVQDLRDLTPWKFIRAFILEWNVKNPINVNIVVTHLLNYHHWWCTCVFIQEKPHLHVKFVWSRTHASQLWMKHKCIGEKPYSCHNCGKRFTERKAIKEPLLSQEEKEN